MAEIGERKDRGKEKKKQEEKWLGAKCWQSRSSLTKTFLPSLSSSEPKLPSFSLLLGREREERKEGKKPLQFHLDS